MELVVPGVVINEVLKAIAGNYNRPEIDVNALRKEIQDSNSNNDALRREIQELRDSNKKLQAEELRSEKQQRQQAEDGRKQAEEDRDRQAEELRSEKEQRQQDEARHAAEKAKAEARVKKANEEDFPEHRKMSEEALKEAQQNIDPNFRKKMNVAVAGGTGVGKTSLINALTKKTSPSQAGYGEVGTKETTMELTKYEMPDRSHVWVWDLPGAGTLLHPTKPYIGKWNLMAFDLIVNVIRGRITGLDLQIAKLASGMYGIPVAFVKNWGDNDVTSKMLDNGLSEEEAKRALVREFDYEVQALSRETGINIHNGNFKHFVISSRMMQAHLKGCDVANGFLQNNEFLAWLDGQFLLKPLRR